MKQIVNDVQKKSLTSVLSDIPKKVLEHVKIELARIDTFDFNIFELDKLIQKKALYLVLNQILNRYNFFEILVEKNYINFIHEIIDGYDRKIPYHNDMHATDVLQTTYILISKGDLAKVNKLILMI